MVRSLSKKSFKDRKILLIFFIRIRNYKNISAVKRQGLGG